MTSITRRWFISYHDFPLFIVVSGVVASVVASMRANGCSHSVSSHYMLFFTAII